jgi:hypothetical protein
MKKKIRYTDGPIGRFRIVKDFLPSPDVLMSKQDHVKVTINLDRSSVEFFKQLSKKGKTPYQKVIRNLLDFYASHAAV